ncbi:hypothetical protein [Bifidobacterium myosotis]|uniref:Uncharacterized protein n=1 Tax=Bifidobacterium myosotis TaxID=1630166 RepID=A0A5M9ZH28_9BIFI|nr:hypothetical protein [Bifidobacterium myosotis]KAA8826921.1 hypothetical protein EMO91_10335 [Bifidobacterium myosotis]
MTTLTRYERTDPKLGVHVLWDSSADFPSMPMDEFERRAAALTGLLPAGARDAAAQRLGPGSDHGGERAHPYDAAQLHVWELSRLEGRGRPQELGPYVIVVSDDGLPNLTVGPDDDLKEPAALAAAAGWPLLRVWMRDEDEPMPYRFLLIRP